MLACLAESFVELTNNKKSLVAKHLNQLDKLIAISTPKEKADETENTKTDRYENLPINLHAALLEPKLDANSLLAIYTKEKELIQSKLSPGLHLDSKLTSDLIDLYRKNCCNLAQDDPE